MFRRRREEEQPNTSPANPEPTVSSDGFDPTTYRTALFNALTERLGKDGGALMEEDFTRHITKDPINGVEQAYFCLVGKLVDYIDAITGSPLPSFPSGQSAATRSRSSASTPTSGPAGFVVFRKEN